MHSDYTDLVAMVQPVINNLSVEMMYKFWLDILPRKKFFTKYISSKQDNQLSKFTTAIEFLAGKLHVSIGELSDYLVAFEPSKVNDLLVEELFMWGYDKDDVRKQFNLKI